MENKIKIQKRINIYDIDNQEWIAQECQRLDVSPSEFVDQVLRDRRTSGSIVAIHKVWTVESALADLLKNKTNSADRPITAEDLENLFSGLKSKASETKKALKIRKSTARRSKTVRIEPTLAQVGEEESSV